MLYRAHSHVKINIEFSRRYIAELVQERRDSSVLEMSLRLSWPRP